MPRKSTGGKGVHIRVDVPSEKTEGEGSVESSPETESVREAGARARADVEELTVESGQGAVTTIERTDGLTGKVHYCGTYATKIVNKQFCAEHFGGGEYVLESRVPKKGGGLQFSSRVRFSIDPSVQPIRPAPSAPAGGAALGTDGAMLGMVQGLLTQQLESAQAYHRLNMEMFDKRAGGFDWKPLVPVLVVVAEGLLNGRNRGKDPLELALRMVREMKPEERERRGLGDLLEEFETLQKLREMVGGGGDSEKSNDRVLGIIDRGASIFERILAQRGERPAVAGGRRAAVRSGPLPESVEDANVSAMPSADPSAALVEEPPAPRVRLEKSWALELKQYLPEIPKFAAFSPPDAAAAIVYENLPDTAFHALRSELVARLEPGKGAPEDVEQRAIAWSEEVAPLLEVGTWEPEVRVWFRSALLELALRVVTDLDIPDLAPPAPGAPTS